MEVKLDPKLVAALNKAGPIRRDWRAIVKRMEALEGRWLLVASVESNAAGIVAVIKERLMAVGCRAEVVALQGMMVNQRPWSGWKVFARLPDSAVRDRVPMVKR